MAFHAFDIHINELGIRDLQFIPSNDRSIRFAILYKFRGRRQVRVYSLDVPNRQVIDISPRFSELAIPETSNALIPVDTSSFLICSNSQLLLCEYSPIPATHG